MSDSDIEKIREKIRNKIDDYEQTIYAIVGFMNFYRLDEEKNLKEDVMVFQGRRFSLSAEKAAIKNEERNKSVTPDIAILLPGKKGVLGEVKMSFPSNQDYWLKIFKQLKSYDDDLTGWPTEDEKVNSHDVILLLHISRTVAVYEYYNSLKEKGIKIDRPFSIVECNQSTQTKDFYFFRKHSGEISDKAVNERLKYGVQVPMKVFRGPYFTIKLYDADPPLPYLLFLIWQFVIVEKASETKKFRSLRSNQKLEVNLEIETIIEELHQGFSFRQLHKNESNRLPRIPKKEWVKNACHKFVELKEAKWASKDKSLVTFFFRHYDDVLFHFIESCLEDELEGVQKKLFKEEESE